MATGEGLPPDEEVAARIVSAELGVSWEPWDVKGKEAGSYDVRLGLGGGEYGALEVTWLGPEAALERDSLVSRASGTWPVPGRWTWMVQVGDAVKLSDVKRRFPTVARICEANDVDSPDRLIGRPARDPDVVWMRDADVSLLGIPLKRGREARVYLERDAIGGFVGSGADALVPAISEAFTEYPHLSDHVRKLAGARGVRERHLFLIVHMNGIPWDAFWVLGDRDGPLPSGPPVIDPCISHLWLAPESGWRGLHWDRDSWRAFRTTEPGD